MREMIIIKKNQNEMPEIKKWQIPVTKMANVFMGLFIRLDTAEVCISDLEHISAETFKSEKDKGDWKRIAYWRRMGHCKWCNIQIKGILWKERKKKRNKYLRGHLGGPVVRTLLFHCKGHGFYPWSGNKDLACFGVSLPPPPKKSKWKAE